MNERVNKGEGGMKLQLLTVTILKYLVLTEWGKQVTIQTFFHHYKVAGRYKRRAHLTKMVIWYNYYYISQINTLIWKEI